MNKTCTQCGCVKSLEDFHRLNSSSDGYRGACKKCRVKERRAYYVENRDVRVEYSKKYRKTDKGKKVELESSRRYKKRQRKLVVEKECTICCEVKPIQEFENSKGRRLVQCELCRDGQKRRVLDKARIVAKQYYDDNREEILRLNKEQYHADPRKKLLKEAKKRAKKKGLGFDLVVEDIVIPDSCPALGIPIFVGDGQATLNSPSIDRIDNNKGYTHDNVVVVSLKANTMKGAGGVDDLKKLVEFYENLNLRKLRSCG